MRACVIQVKLDIVEMGGVWKVACVRGWNVRQLVIFWAAREEFGE